jgi:hypothetical protein
MSKLDLSSFAYVPIDSDDPNKIYSKPFSVLDIVGNVWNVVTNREWLVAVKGKAVYGRWKGGESQLNAVLKFVQSNKINPRRIAVTKLQDLVTKSRTGVFKFPREENQEGDGRAVVQLSKLATVLEACTKEYLEVWDASTTANYLPCVGLSEPGRRMFLMGWTGSLLTAEDFDVDGESEKSQPTVQAVEQQEFPEGMDAFDIMMSLE